jgi:hypothetical protein
MKRKKTKTTGGDDNHLRAALEKIAEPRWEDVSNALLEAKANHEFDDNDINSMAYVLMKWAKEALEQ